MLHNLAETPASKEAGYSSPAIAFANAVARVFRPGDFPWRSRFPFLKTTKLTHGICNK